MQEIVNAYNQGLQSTDACGRKCVIFVYIASFVADYPISYSVLDMTSHSAHSPCTHWTFRKIEWSAKVNTSQLAHSLAINSANSSLVRGLF